MEWIRYFDLSLVTSKEPSNQIFFGKELFYFICAQHVLSYHLIEYHDLMVRDHIGFTAPSKELIWQKRDIWTELGPWGRQKNSKHLQNMFFYSTIKNKWIISNINRRENNNLLKFYSKLYRTISYILAKEMYVKYKYDFLNIIYISRQFFTLCLVKIRSVSCIMYTTSLFLVLNLFWNFEHKIV